MMLSPFLKENELIRIFGKNMFADASLEPLFNQLTGVADEKPFDCVGTIREVNVALCETIRQRKETELPDLVRRYRNSQIYPEYSHVDFFGELSHISDCHNLPKEFLKIVRDCYMW